ncbi:MAG: hypothetical protein K2O34_08625, partial [Acetatifactor sp.]|nr:hypothetical protein [Acetatifactor sp.]
MQRRGKLGSDVPNTDWCNITGETCDMQGKGKLGSETSKYALRNIAGRDSDIHKEENMTLQLLVAAVNREPQELAEEMRID